ncbi:glycosyl hydrolase [Pseudomassariella vexata]|uniref:Glycosyl hydrolase n=1 Tax=Pseudomassariella vexata TaxID=1141098 RepID=A0A1Y2D8Z9_9PEZI|nr:glycosyl hydrolase [Pseudomassariella vexata]ORY55687.1 glycosyl hydrolase [Pseudomassariella vexata]
MSRNQGIMTGTGGRSELLQTGFTQKAFTALIEQYPDDDDVQQYITTSAASVIPFIENATYDALSYPMDRLSNGNALLALYEQTGNTTYGNAADALRRSIDLNRRNEESGLWYYVYPYWSYLDGMFSLAPFYTISALPSQGNGTENLTALDDMQLQLDLLWQHCRNASSGLLVHGYDATRMAVWADPETGSSPHVWGRSLGWYAMALVDTLDLLPSSPAKYKDRLLDMFQDLAGALVDAVDPLTGGWWQVLDQPGREGNYIESSASAMFSYALLKGVRLGYLATDSEAPTVAARAHTYLTSVFAVREADGTLGYNGTVSVCSLNSTASYEYYVGQSLDYNSVLGSAAFVLASLEVERSHNV